MKSGNPILDKNLDCIEKYNPLLKEKLLELPYLTAKIELIETELHEPNLSFNDLPLHNKNGAEIEAKELFKKAADTKLSTHVIFGLGIGHLFKEFCDNSMGSVILYEPNLEILRVALELVDFSNEFSKKNVRVASDYQELKNTFESIYKYKTEVNLLFLDSYKELYKNEINPLFKYLETIKGGCALEFNALRNRGMEFVTSVLVNFNNTLETIPLMEFKNIYKGKTALIVSAGPTLDRNIETIKKNRDKFVLFCVGTAFKALAKEGITPDFLNIIEINDSSAQVRGFDLSAIKLIIEPFSCKSSQVLNVKQKFLYPAITTQGAQYWSHLTGMDISGYISGGTVSYEALECAKMLGCTKLILVGQDLAYVDGKCYSNNSNSSDLVIEVNSETKAVEFKVKDKRKLLEDLSPQVGTFTEEIVENFATNRVNDANDSLSYVKGITGEMLPTHKGYAHFVEQFNEFAYENKDLDLINTSMIGAELRGFKNITLEQALENSKPVEKKEFYSQFRYDKNQILENLIKERSFFEKILKDFENTKECFFKFEREIKRSKTITKDANKYYKKLLEIYDNVTVEYFEKSQLFQLIAMTESLDLKYYADATEDIGDERTKNIFNLLKAYFQNNEKKLLILLNELNNQIIILSEKNS